LTVEISTRSNLLVLFVLNTELVQGYTERMSQSDLVVVQSYGTEGEAEVAKGVLESSGIDAMIQADTAGRMREHLAWSGLGHRVLVREEDAVAARSLLALPQNGKRHP
jgi:Putative prokaryotic signal transducing protein